MIKKIIIGLGVLLALIILAAIVLPVVFKDDIVKIAKEEANNNLNARLNFGDFSLSMFRNFPNFTLSIEDVSIVGKDAFAGDTLAYMGELSLAVDLMSVINGMDPINVKSVGISDAVINGIVTKSGKANWDIAKPSETDQEETAAEGSQFHLNLEEYYIENTHITYSDTSMGLYADLRDFNHKGTGDFTQDIFTFSTRTTSSAMTVNFGGIPYLSRVDADIKVDMDMDIPGMKFTFSENEIRLNQLLLGFDGFIAMPGDDIQLDMTFNAKQTDFRNILSLVPAVFKRDFESVQTAGKLSLDGFVKGTSSDEAIPGFGLNLKVEDAMFKYPDLPKAARNIQVALNINNPGGSADQTLIDLKKFHAEVAGQPLNMTLHLATPISDPDMDMNVKSQINLSNLRDVIPMEEGEQYSGMLTADLNLKGKLSAIEKERYDNFHAAGKIILLDMKSSDPDSYDISVKKMSLNFSPRFVELAAFESVINKSDIAATGKILNILGWYFKDENLTGRFDMQSKHLDLNAFTTEEENIPEAGGEAGLTVIEVPKNLDFTLGTNMGELIFENLTMKDVSGEVILRDGKAILKHLRMKALDGSMDVSGTYSTLNPERPSVDFDVDISHVDIKKTYDTFESVQKMAPIAEHCTGKISTDMEFSTELDAHMEPIMDKMTGKGHLKTDHVVVNNSGVFSKIADVLKMDQYRKMDLDNVNFTYEFKDGRVVVDPFEMPVSHGKANVNGSSGFDQTLSYVMQLDVPVTDVGTAGMRVVNGLVSQANSAGANFSVGDRVNLSLIIGGTTLNPTVKPHYGKSSDGAAEGIKEQAIEKVEEVKEQVKEEVKQNIKEQAEKILNEAKKKADAIRAEAKRSAEKFRSEGYANARKVEDQAGNPLAKIAAKKTADKMRSETDKKADQIIAEGNKKADAVMDAARKRVDQLK